MGLFKKKNKKNKCDCNTKCSIDLATIIYNLYRYSPSSSINIYIMNDSYILKSSNMTLDILNMKEYIICSINVDIASINEIANILSTFKFYDTTSYNMIKF